MSGPDRNRDSSEERLEMVEQQIAARGVRSERVINAMKRVPREAFLPEKLREFAYQDSPLPIAEGQTISQPYIVALMIEALALQGGENVLEIGTGSGYAAAVLAQIAGAVYTIERFAPLANAARQTLLKLGYTNCHVLQDDGTRGWPEHAPYDAIVVTASSPSIPESLKQQLAVGGHMIIPVGKNPRAQELVRVTRTSPDDYLLEDLADVCFVPLVGEHGWQPRGPNTALPRTRPEPHRDEAVLDSIADSCEPFIDIESADLAPLLNRIGDSRVVLIGEASHGTSEFYSMRAKITQALIIERDFRIVAIEGDWPDAARIDHFVRHFGYPPSEWTAFARFPTWMWRNNEVRQFVDWLRDHNLNLAPERRVAFRGLDLYSLYTSIRAILKYLDEVDPDTAKIARERYGCLNPWQADPATYGHSALTGLYQDCEAEVIHMLSKIATKHQAYAEHDGERFLDAMQNATLVANAEKYYRTMYYGSRSSWNLRDGYMFDTLKRLLVFHGERSKAIVWAHNSHVGDASATEMSARGEHNIGSMCRKEFGDAAYSIGFGTDNGTVAAASDWDGPMEIKPLRAAHANSYERLFHNTGIPRLMLSLRDAASRDVCERLTKPRLERAVGVIYRPETELASHYFQAVLPRQFDEYIWFDTSSAIHPFATEELEGIPETYPFGL